jgi:hypothetical protein
MICCVTPLWSSKYLSDWYLCLDYILDQSIESILDRHNTWGLDQIKKINWTIENISVRLIDEDYNIFLFHLCLDRNLLTNFSKKKNDRYLKIKFSLISQHKVTIILYIKFCPCSEVFTFKDHVYKRYYLQSILQTVWRFYQICINVIVHTLSLSLYVCRIFFSSSSLQTDKTNYLENRTNILPSDILKNEINLSRNHLEKFDYSFILFN